MKKHLLKTVLLAVALLLGTTSTWAADPIAFKAGNTIGATDNTTDWYGANSETIELGPHETLTLKFKTYTATDKELNGAEWNDQMTHAINIWDGREQNLYMYGSGWGYKAHSGKVNDPEDYTVFTAGTNLKTYGWATDYRTMIGKGADVVLKVARFGSEIRISQEFTTASGSNASVSKYYHYFVGTFGLAEGNVWLQLTVNKAHIDITADSSISDSETITGTLLGVENNTGGFGAGVRKDFTIAPNSTQSFHFKNYSNKINKWNNWAFEMDNGAGAFADIVSGGASWGALINEDGKNVDFTASKWPAGTDDDFKDAYNGADVKLTITREGAKVSVEAVHTAVDNETWTVKYSFTPDEEGFATSNANFRLLTEGGHIDLLPYELNVSANDAAYGTVEAGTAYAGEEVTVTATPNAGFTFVNWTEGENEVSTDATYTFKALADRTLVANFAPAGTVVGATNFSTASLDDYSTPVTLSQNQKVTYTFYNYSDKLNNAHNWLACVGGETFATDALNVALRADNWENVQGGNTGLSSNYNWDTFRDEMNGAKVVLSFAYQNNAVIIHADITAKSNNTYFEEFTKKGITGDITVALGVENSFLVITDQATENLTVATETKDMSAAGWATYYSAKALDLTGEIEHLTDAYIITGAEDGHVATVSVKGEVVPANTGLLLAGEEGAIVLPVADSRTATADVAENALEGVVDETVKDAGTVYVLMNEDKGVGFYKNTNAFTVGKNTAYLPSTFAASISSAAPRFFALDGNTTGIDALDAENTTEKATGAIYNLAGQRVGKGYKGLVIMNGKKVIIK